MSEDQDLIWLDEPLENQVVVLQPWLHPSSMANTNMSQCQMVSEKITFAKSL